MNKVILALIWITGVLPACKLIGSKHIPNVYIVGYWDHQAAFWKNGFMKQIKSITPKEVVPGITGYYAHGDQQTFGYVEIKKGSVLPEHHHVHEQITYILEGQLNMVTGGEQCPLTAGMYHVIHSNVPHSAVAITDCKVIDAFSPPREDYK